ncbi:MAG: protein kinase [Deltaproteobacteria bacterium]|nr:protein kinase [Deltaproteobacteria bacterium]
MATCPECQAHYPDTAEFCLTDGTRLLPDEACQNFDADLKSGDIVGEYQVEKKIGEGAFGKVYAAVHPVIGKRAAIKVLNREYSSNPSVVSRFVSEARSVNQIRHRNIIDVFSFGTLPGGLQYFTMELLDGVTFDAHLEERGALPVSEAVGIMRDIGRALDAAHKTGVAHRDLKPENVFLSFDDEGRCFPKLLDFGIAKLMGDDTVQHKTRTGAAMGTPLYMSPEQCRGKGVDHRTDIYSFGVMMHEVLTGQRPFDGDSMMDLMMKQATEPPPPMSQINPAVPAALDGPVLQMLAKEPAERPQTLAEAIQLFCDAAAGAGVDTGTVLITAAGRSGTGVPGIGTATGGAAQVSTQDTSTADTMAMDPGSAMAAAQASGTGQPGQNTTMGGVEAAPMSAAKPSGGAGGKIGMALGALVVVGAVAAFFLTRSPDETAAPDAATTASAAPVESTAEPAASAPPSASASAATPGEPMVMVTIESTVPGIEVSLNGKQIGTSDEAFEIPKGDTEIELTFEKPGHVTKTKKVTPRADLQLEVPLQKLGGPPVVPGKPKPPVGTKPPDSHPDTPNPFD